MIRGYRAKLAPNLEYIVRVEGEAFHGAARQVGLVELFCLGIGLAEAHLIAAVFAWSLGAVVCRAQGAAQGV